EDKLKKLDGAETTDSRRSSRPFGENCGFTMAEASQYVVLMDDALALEMGADIHGAVTDVFINADGFKKSISAPGPGNYITMAKAVASACALVGEDLVRNASMIQAHGSSTPQNLVTESQIFDQVAQVFGIENWPLAAVKAYVGHSLSAASGEQLITSLGVFRYGWVPGIKTIDKVADDVVQARLQISTRDQDRRDKPVELAFLNSKGFGGNNATGVVLSPRLTETLLENRYTTSQLADYRSRREQTRAQAAAYDERASQGQFDTIYHFGEGLIDESLIQISRESISLPGISQPIPLAARSRFSDLAAGPKA